MTDRAKFDLDLAKGEARETAFVQALLTCTVEHKCDDWAPATGCVFIETACRNQPSGLAVTAADWWALEVQDDTWLVVRTSSLRAAVARADHLGHHLGSGGDDRQSTGYLIPVEWLVRGVPR